MEGGVKIKGKTYISYARPGEDWALEVNAYLERRKVSPPLR